MPKVHHSIAKKTQIVTMYKEGKSMGQIASQLGLSKQTVHMWVKRANFDNLESSLARKKGSGGIKKTSKETDRMLKFEIMKNPRKSAKELKAEHPDVLGNVSERTIQERLQKDLGLPSMRAAKKPLLTKAMKAKRLAFAKKYLAWNEEQWSKVMFSDESMFKCIQVTGKRVRRSRGSDRHNPKYTEKTVKHPDQVMIWGCYSGVGGRGGLYFLPKNVTMNSDRYLEVLRDHLFTVYNIHDCTHFMQDGAPCHRTKKVAKALTDAGIEVIDWPGNSPDLNPIENVWGYMKRKLTPKDITSVPKLTKAIKDMWIKEMDGNYFRELSASMPKRLQEVIEKKGEMLKY